MRIVSKISSWYVFLTYSIKMKSQNLYYCSINHKRKKISKDKFKINSKSSRFASLTVRDKNFLLSLIPVH